MYDYVFAGAGCAGLSLLVHMKEAGLLANKKVLVIDREHKQANDRTWCFWEKEPGPFESVVYRSWQQLDFYGPGFSAPLHIAPYSYKLIRGIDFYNYCFAQLGDLPEVEWLCAPVGAVANSAADMATVSAGGQQYRGRLVFNSIVAPQPPILAQHHYWLLQHFKGWIIETPDDRFDPQKPTLMDFRVGQEHGCTFVYVLPFSKRRALVEYTLFSEKLLPPEAYDAALDDYLRQFLHLETYRVAETEFGVIPMTNYAFPQGSDRVCQIGTAGGFTKGSSGYTFRFIQKKSARMVASLKAHGHPFAGLADAARFAFYDSVLLHVLHHRQMAGDRIFARLFRKNKAQEVLRFLDNETNIPGELQILGSMPSLTFSRAALRYLVARMFKR
ncbi:hypothetical protein BUE76_19840 [Cnuella takakiae]|nr:hypothetical protein BUE76_19840 [Cnuella takakiae]